MNKMERFIKANGNGQSQCYNCGSVEWDSRMYKDTKYEEHNRLCSHCLKLFGKKEFYEVKIQWKGFKPYHRESEQKK